MAITKIGTPELFDFSATNTALQLPTGPTTGTGGRPATPSTGEWRFNTTLKYVEYYDGGAWRQIDTESAAVFKPSENFNTNTYFGTGATQAIDAKFNEAANFNGTSSFIKTTYIVPAISTQSISVWFNTSTSSGYRTLFSDAPSNGAAVNVRMQLYTTPSSTFEIVIGNNIASWAGQSNSISSYLDGDWHNIVVTYSSTSVKSYIDGSLFQSFTSSVSFGTAGNQSLVFGKAGLNNVNYWNGSIDQVRIFNTALTADQAEDLFTDETTTTAATLDFPVGAGCIAAYQLDGNGNDVGTTTATTVATYQLNGATTSIPGDNFPGVFTNSAYATGKFGNAAVFNGSSSKIVLPTTTFDTIKSNKSFAVSAWFNTSNTGTRQFIFSAFESSYLMLEVTTSNQLKGTVSNDAGSNTELTVLTTVTDGNWHHAVFTGDNGSLALYLDNGTPQTSSSWNGTFFSGTGGIGIGIRMASNDYWNGKIDQVRLFDTVLPQSAVTVLYNETVATSSSPSITYVGTPFNGTTTDIGYTGLEFSPSLVWVKNRTDNSTQHLLTDTVRGIGSNGGANILYADSPEQESTNADTGFLSSFDSNGFTVGNNAIYNNSGKSFVAWCWKAAASTTTIPASGSQISSDVRANVDAGFSIVKATSPSSGVFTVGHGLNAAPELYIIKNLDSAGGWLTYVKLLGADKYLQLNDSSAEGTNTNFWDNTSATPTVFTMKSGSVIATNVDFSAYCWHSVSGYQKIGSYEGTGNNLTVYTTDDGSSTGANGFQPSFVMIKRYTGGNGNWVIVDEKRASGDNRLYANLSNAEDPGQGESFISNGFKPRQSSTSDTNINGSFYIYLAIK